MSAPDIPNASNWQDFNSGLIVWDVPQEDTKALLSFFESALDLPVQFNEQSGVTPRTDPADNAINQDSNSFHGEQL